MGIDLKLQLTLHHTETKKKKYKHTHTQTMSGYQLENKSALIGSLEPSVQPVRPNPFVFKAKPHRTPIK